jgi:glutathione synthase
MGFLMDPVERIRVGHDTTFALMLEARRRGLEVRCFDQQHLSWRDAQPCARMRAVELRLHSEPHFEVLREAVAPLSDLDVLFMRKDPPVDVAFLHASQIVEAIQPAALDSRLPVVINSPDGLRSANEKLFALRFPDLIPTSLVSSDVAEVVDFVAEVGGSAVLKPLDGFGGKGILLARSNDPALVSLVETMTRGGAVMAQRFLPEVSDGDKRVLMLDGEPIGAVLRMAKQGDFRCNMAAGGQPKKTTLTSQERKACEKVGKELNKRGLFFVGLDFIGERLTEINVTSPTGLVEIEVFDGAGLAARVIDFALNRAKTFAR